MLAVPLGYLLGSLPFAVISSRLLGLADPRSYGSKNPGATNVLRSGNKLAALLTLLGDAAKGWLAVFIAMHWANTSNTLIAATVLAVFLGHLFPLFLGFKGGKGVATAAGILPDSSREVRRTRVRTLLADHFEALPFLVVADTRGYFRPANYEEARHYIANLISRSDNILVRLESFLLHLRRTPWRTYSPDPRQIDSVRKHLSSLQ